MSEVGIENEKHVLLIEDNTPDADLIIEYLEDAEESFSVSHHQDLSSALEELESRDFHVILSDLGLPDSAGLETYRQLNEKAPHLPIILLTGLDDSAVASAALREGVQDYINKGEFDGQVLMRAIRYAMERKEASLRMQAQSEELEQVNRELKAFTSYAAHELKSPVSVLTGMLEMLEDELGEDANKTVRHLLERSVANVKKMGSMIQDILSYSRARQDELESHNVNISSLAAVVVDELKTLNKEYGVKFEITQGLSCKGDPRYLNNLVSNLIRNAWKYSRNSPNPKVFFGAEEHEKGLVFYVSDNGIGLPEQEVGKLFQPFARLSNATNIEGTGMGLPLARRIVERHGGSIWAKNSKEGGSVFFFTIGWKPDSPLIESGLRQEDPEDPNATNNTRVQRIRFSLSSRERQGDMSPDALRWLQPVLESLPGILVILNREGKILLANQNLSRRYGKDLAEVVGMNAYDLISRELMDERMKRIEQVFKEGIRVEFQDVSKGRTLEHRVEPVFDSLGKVNACVAYAEDITDRRRQQRMSLESDERLWRTVSDAPIPMLVHAEDGEIITLSEALLESTGFSRQELKYYKDWLSKACPDRESESLGVFSRLRQPGDRVNEGLFVIHTKLSSPKKWDVSTSMIGNLPDGRRLAVTIASDVTELTAATRTAQNQNRLLEGINTILMESYKFRTDQQISQFCLKQAQMMTGAKYGFIGELNSSGTMDTTAMCDTVWSQCKVGGEGPANLVYGMTVRGVFSEVMDGRKTMLLEDPHSADFSLGIPEGHPKLKNFLGIPFWRGGRVTGMLALSDKEEPWAKEEVEQCERLAAVIAEVISRNRDDIRMRDSEEAYRMLFNNSTDGIVLADPKSRKLVRCNPEFSRTTGYSEMMIENMKVDDLHPEKDRAHVLEEFEKNAENPGRVVPELPIQRKDGSIFYADVATYETRIEGQSMLAGFFRDVTRRKEESEEMKELLSELQRSNRDLEQFAFAASHDLQEPLRSIASYAQLMNKKYQDHLDEKAKTWLGYLVEGAVRMQELVRGLLAYSRLTGESLRIEKVNLNEVLNDALTIVKPLIKNSGAVVKHDELPELFCNRSQITRLFENIISNAIKYRGEQAPTIIIEAEDSRDGKFLVIRIQDNGIGIQKPYREKVFDIFRRLHSRKDYAGTGLGLALCKKIVEHHDGEIRIIDNPDGSAGVTVDIRLSTRLKQREHNE